MRLSLFPEREIGGRDTGPTVGNPTVRLECRGRAPVGAQGVGEGLLDMVLASEGQEGWRGRDGGMLLAGGTIKNKGLGRGGVA